MSRATTNDEAAAGVSGAAVVVYEAADGEARVDVRLERETVWLTQRQMADVFLTSTDNVGLHLKNIFGDGELQEKATTEDFSVVKWRADGACVEACGTYNLDPIISEFLGRAECLASAI
ncbi:MAG: death-on-curing protein [Gammaproteobacteria bacterium]|nr:death-on-curing protein [Gammaproteobacteria bacterium]